MAQAVLAGRRKERGRQADGWAGGTAYDDPAAGEGLSEALQTGAEH